MVQKNLITSCYYQFIAKRRIIHRFRKMNKVNYREEDEIINSPQSCTSLECSTYRTSRDSEIDITRQKEIQVYSRHEKKEDVTEFIPKLIA